MPLHRCVRILGLEGIGQLRGFTRYSFGEMNVIDLGSRRAMGELEENDFAQIGQRLVHGDALDATDAENGFQMLEEHRFVSDFLENR